MILLFPVYARAARSASRVASVPELVKLDGLSARHEVHDVTCPLHLQTCIAAGVGATADLGLNRFHHRRMGVTEQHRPVPHPIVDIAVAIHVPLVGAEATVDIERKRLKGPRHMGYAAGQQVFGRLV